MVNKRELLQQIIEEVNVLEKRFYKQAPLNILFMNLEEIFSKKEIKNGIDELINKNIIEKIDDNYIRSCY